MYLDSASLGVQHHVTAACAAHALMKLGRGVGGTLPSAGKYRHTAVPDISAKISVESCFQVMSLKLLISAIICVIQGILFAVADLLTHCKWMQCQLYLELITLNSNNSLYKHWLLLPEMLLLFKGTCCWMKDDDIACCRIPKTRFDMWQVIM